jgi:hypothetical protein
VSGVCVCGGGGGIHVTCAQFITYCTALSFHTSRSLIQLRLQPINRYALRINNVRAHVAEGTRLDPATVSLNAFASSHRSDDSLDLATRSGQWGKQRRWKGRGELVDDLVDEDTLSSLGRKRSI